MILSKFLFFSQFLITFVVCLLTSYQRYVADDENSFAIDGKLHIKPTLTANKIGYNAVENGYVRLDDCTDPNEGINNFFIENFGNVYSNSFCYL